MIRGRHTVIRTAEPDDAPAFQALYWSGEPRSALLTRTREFLFPTIDEIREAFGPAAEKAGGGFHAVEDPEGRIRAFCALRGMQDVRDTAFYAELAILFCDPADAGTPVADEMLAWLLKRAFDEQRLNKVVVHALLGETELTAWYRANGFESNGVQRDVLFAGGAWHSMETFTRPNPARYAEAGSGASGIAAD